MKAFDKYFMQLNCRVQKILPLLKQKVAAYFYPRTEECFKIMNE